MILNKSLEGAIAPFYSYWSSIEGKMYAYSDVAKLFALYTE